MVQPEMNVEIVLRLFHPKQIIVEFNYADLHAKLYDFHLNRKAQN